jgi:hypothetical protein
MTATVVPMQPKGKRVLTLRCGHPQESGGRAGSSLTCRTCGDHGKITNAIVRAAEAKATPVSPPLQQRAAPAAVRPPAGEWAPRPIARQRPDEQPGSCPDCGGPRSWAGRASLARCTQCGTPALAPRTLRAHTSAAGPQQHRDTGERDNDAEDLYQRLEALLDGLDPLLDDRALDADDRGTLKWLKAELIEARRTKNATRVAELAARAAGLDLGDDTEPDVWEADDSLDDDQAEVSEAGSATPAEPLAFLVRTTPAPVVSPFRMPAPDAGPFQMPANPARRSRPAARRRKKQPQPQNWLLPRPSAPAVNPLLQRGDAARAQMTRDGNQITAGLADAAARRQHVTPSLLAEGIGNPWRVPEPGGGPKLVAAEFYQLPASRRAAQPAGLRRLLHRGQSVTAPGRLAIEGGAGSDWYAQYDAAQATAWTAAGGRQP